jgi:L-ascorbate metabolism protein UlaG (beta-lactamase superfamily)
MAGHIKVKYLSHSGFMIEYKNTVLIFDYYPDPHDNKELDAKIIDLSGLKDKKVLVFSSHRHPDHFNPVILSWKNELNDIEYYFSSDIPKKYHHEFVCLLRPYQTYEDEGIRIQTLKSTDEGVAFLVSFSGITVYHAGDLNWWHWNDESKAANNDMAARFKHEISLLKDVNIDIAFLAADPRQEDAELWGLNWFMEHVNVKTVFPMHFWDDYSIMDRIKSQAQKKPGLKKVRHISKRGEVFNVPIT